MTTIATLQEVVLDIHNPREPYKFIVAQITDGQNGNKLVVRAHSVNDLPLHADIYNVLQQQVGQHGLNARCIGGGRLEFFPDHKFMRIKGSSDEFGVEPDRQETLRLLRAAFPEFRVVSE